MKEQNTQEFDATESTNEQNLDDLVPLVFSELHRLAKRYMSKEREGHTLQATCLVNEAFVNLIEHDVKWQNQGHFYVIAARQMRRILVDHARAKGATKRGSDKFISTFVDSIMPDNQRPVDEIIQLDQLLTQLNQKDKDTSEIFELKYFAGLSLPEIAQLRGVSLATIEREMRFAKAWLTKKLQ